MSQCPAFHPAAIMVRIFEVLNRQGVGTETMAEVMVSAPDPAALSATYKIDQRQAPDLIRYLARQLDDHDGGSLNQDWLDGLLRGFVALMRAEVAREVQYAQERVQQARERQALYGV